MTAEDKRTAARHRAGQKWIKRVVLEMGGKDCVVVDETADLEALRLAPWRALSGSRAKMLGRLEVIVVEDVYEEMVARSKKKTEKLTVGETTDPDNHMGR